jgi:hypothetical protein
MALSAKEIATAETAADLEARVHARESANCMSIVSR